MQKSINKKLLLPRRFMNHDEDCNKSLSSDAEDILIPCEFCERQIPISDLIVHETSCKPDLVSYAHPNPRTGTTPNKLISEEEIISLSHNYLPQIEFFPGPQALTVGAMSQNVMEVIWNIDGFFTSSYNPSSTIKSPTFRFARYAWRLAAWPNGNSASPDHLVVWLSGMETQLATSQDFSWTIGLKRNDNVVHSSESGVLKLGSSESGVLKLGKIRQKWKYLCTALFLSQSQLLEQKDVIASHTHLKVFCRLSTAATTEELQQKNTSVAKDTLCSNLRHLFLSSEDSDVTIEVKDKEFKVHRAILRARTPVLHAMFSHDMAESSSRVVSVVDCEPDAFREFLLFVYSGSAENLSEENVTNVYYVADKYDLPELKRACVQFMRAALSPNSICDVVRLATSHGEHQLLEEATQFFAQNVEEILPTVKWQRFLRESSIKANELLIKTFKTAYVKKA